MTTGDVALVTAILTLSVYVIDVAMTKTEEPKTPQQVEESIKTMYDIKKITLEGHEYWFFCGYEHKGGSLCHSESCGCRKEQKK